MSYRVCFVFALLSGFVCAADFEEDIAPILTGRCLECHNPKELKGGLNLTSAAGLLAGGESGHVISGDDPKASLLLERVTSGEMPPPTKGQSQQLPADEIAALREWIAAGANWPGGRTLSLFEKSSHVRAGRDWWSLQPVHRPEVPSVADRRVANPIDAYVQEKLIENKLSMAPRADRLALVRRAYFDLIGLPPTPEQIDKFVNDRRSDAWERLIDELLASPHHGERWARYWLDVVRFAETNGYERDKPKPGIWKYRDWVIDAFNADMPYDRFVTYQLAGDEVSDRDESSVVATGMIRAGTWNDEPNDPADYVYERLEDMVHSTSSAFLGLTVKCARCHDHKFDPIAQTDYYRMASFFWSGYIGQANLGGPDKDQLGFDVFGWTDTGRDVKPIHLLIKGNRQQPGEIVEPGFLSAVPSLDQALSLPPPEAKTTRRRLQLAKWISDSRNPLTARVIVNRLWQHHFGQAIVRTPNNFGFKGDRPTHPKLLDWLAAELVTPTVEVATGHPWTLKRLHKLIMMSATYRQASLHPQAEMNSQTDAQNRFFWKFNRRRQDAEALRDAMLAVSGELNRKMYGESFYPRMSDEALEGLSRKSEDWTESPADERRRRSIYMMTKRSRILPLMTTFDFCDTTRPSAQRDSTVQPTQALAMLNNQFVHERSMALAKRVLAEDFPSDAARIRHLWRLVLGRVPDAEEQNWAMAHLQECLSAESSNAAEESISFHDLAWGSLSHVLLNTNEFMYVD